eukprot:7802157-Heterocapsa_arctica.AAC.1
MRTHPTSNELGRSRARFISQVACTEPSGTRYGTLRSSTWLMRKAHQVRPDSTGPQWSRGDEHHMHVTSK